MKNELTEVKPRITIDGRMVFPGEEAFKLKDSMGFPLAMTIMELAKTNWELDWVGFAKAAREAGWWDYQTIECIEEAFQDAGVWAEKKAHIIEGLKIWIMGNPIGR